MYRYRLLLWFIILVSITATSCFSSSGGNRGNAQGDGSANTADPLSDTESGLYEGGPIDIPVTIAKLDGIDAGKIEVTYSEISPSINMLRETRLASEDDCTVNYLITGSAGAVPDPATTPRVYGLNLENDDEQTVDADSDGSFVIDEICGDVGDRLYLANLTSNENQSGLPVIATIDENGNTTVTNTNAADLNTAINVVTDSSGNTYYVMSPGGSGSLQSPLARKATTGNCDIVKQNQDGSEMEVILENTGDCPRVIASVEEGQIFFLNQNAEVKTLRLEDGNWELTTLYDFTDDYGPFDPADYPGFKIMPVDRSSSIEGTECADTKIPADDFFREDDSTIVPMIDICYPSGNSPYDANQHTDRIFASLSDATRYAFDKWPTSSGSTLLVEDHTDPANVITTNLLDADDLPYYPLSLDASQTGRVVLSGYPYTGDSATDAQNEDQVKIFVYDTDTDTLQEITSPSETGSAYRFPLISANGGFVVACEQGDDGGIINQLVVHRPFSDTPGDFFPLTSGDESACDERLGSFQIAPDNNIHYFSNGQHVIIYAESNPLLRDFLESP